jgi:hypothetical protein
MILKYFFKLSCHFIKGNLTLVNMLTHLHVFAKLILLLAECFLQRPLVLALIHLLLFKDLLNPCLQCRHLTLHYQLILYLLSKLLTV